MSASGEEQVGRERAKTQAGISDDFPSWLHVDEISRAHGDPLDGGEPDDEPEESLESGAASDCPAATGAEAPRPAVALRKGPPPPQPGMLDAPEVAEGAAAQSNGTPAVPVDSAAVTPTTKPEPAANSGNGAGKTPAQPVAPPIERTSQREAAAVPAGEGSAAPEPVVRQRVEAMQAAAGDAAEAVERLRSQVEAGSGAAAGLLDLVSKAQSAVETACEEAGKATEVALAAVAEAGAAREHVLETTRALEGEVSRGAGEVGRQWSEAVTAAEADAGKFLRRAARRRVGIAWWLWLRPAIAAAIAVAVAALVVIALLWGAGEILAARVDKLMRQREILGEAVRAVRAEEWGLQLFERSDGRRHVALPPGASTAGSWTFRGRVVIELPPD